MTHQIVEISQVLLELGLSDSVTEEQEAVVQEQIPKAQGAVIRFLGYDPYQRERTEYYPQLETNGSISGGIWDANSSSAIFEFDGRSSDRMLQLKHIPIRSIASLKVDYDARSGTRSGSFAASTAKTEGDDFWANYELLDSSSNRVCGDGILYNNSGWPRQVGSVQVVYTAGYSIDELRGVDSIINAAPIHDAILNETKRRVIKVFQNRKQAGKGITPGGYTREKLGDYEYEAVPSVIKAFAGDSWDLTQESVEKLNDFVNWGARINL